MSYLVQRDGQASAVESKQDVPHLQAPANFSQAPRCQAFHDEARSTGVVHLFNLKPEVVEKIGCTGRPRYLHVHHVRTAWLDNVVE